MRHWLHTVSSRISPRHCPCALKRLGNWNFSKQILIPNWRKNITLIKNNSEKLFNLTDEIIDLTNINTEDLYSTQIVRLTKDIVSAFKEKYQSSNIQISFIDEITDNDPLVNINVNAWNKVVNHLLSNAVKFTKDFVEVRIKSDKNNVIMAIHDNGIGISESDIDKIFNAFWC